MLDVTVGATFGMPDPKKKFGIEIELEGERLPEHLPEGKWHAKLDGSLRRGMEYITKPTNTPQDDVTSLETMLAQNNAVIKNSYRCSTHIHYNFVDKTWKDVIATIIAWNIAEPLFLRQMPPGRDGSIFCMSAYDTGDLPIVFNKFCSEIHQQFKYVGFQSVCRQKYASLNLTRLGDLGTLEFRIFPPSTDGRQVRKWCVWLDNLVNFASKVKSDGFAEFVTRMEKNPETCAFEIFGMDAEAFNKVELPALVDLGCRTAHELVRVFNASSKKKPRVKKPLFSVENMAVLDDWGEVEPNL